MEETNTLTEAEELASTSKRLKSVVTHAEDDIEVRYDMPWLTSVLRPVLIAIMTACLAIGLLSFLRYAVPSLPFLYTGSTVFLTIVATLLGCISTTWLAQPGQRGKRNTGLRLAELGLLLGLTRLIVWVTVGNWPTFEFFITRPLDALMDGAFVMALIVVGLAWSAASAITGDFLKMSLQPDELYAAQQRTGRSGDDPTPPNYTDRRGVLGGFASKWISGGILMVLLSAGTQLEPSQNGFFAIGRQNIDPVVISATVIYFLVGLILISQGQFAVLRARWTLEKVPSSGSVLRNWPLYGGLMIGGIGLLATLLPFGGTFYFARILYAALRFLFMAAATIVQIALGIFGVLLGLLFGSSEETAVEQPPIEFEPFQMPEAAPAAEGAPPWLGGTIFWIILTLLLGYAAYIYMGGRGLSLEGLRRFWQLLTMRLRQLFGAYDEWRTNRHVDSIDPDSGAIKPTALDSVLNRLRLGNLNPEQQVRYFYMTMLQQAKESGIGRNAGETPLRYAPRLVELLHPIPKPSEPKHEEAEAGDPNMAESEVAQTEAIRAEAERTASMDRSHDRINAITDAFLRNRYAGSGVEPERLPTLKTMWETMKKQIGSAKKAD